MRRSYARSLALLDTLEDAFSVQDTAKRAAIILLLVSLVVAVFFTYTVTKRTLTSVESVLLQLFTLGAGLAGSFIFGQQSASKVARDIIKPHARSAFRRLWSLYESLHRAGIVIQESIDSNLLDSYRIGFAKLDAIVYEQLAAADDALEDWRDIVPEDVEGLHDRLRRRKGRESHND